jgi:hypothetical protein
VSWPPKRGALVEGRPTLSLKANFHLFNKMFPLFLKRKGATSKGKREEVRECGWSVLNTL